MDSKLPVGFYSKTHLTTFLAGIAASIFVDIMIIMMIRDEILVGGASLLLLILIIIEFIVLIKYLTFPMDRIHFDFKKNKDYLKTKDKLEALLKADTTYETKNYIRVQMLRYATIYEPKICEGIIKDLFLPQVRNENYLLDYYTALFEYYLAINSHSKAKNVLNSLTEYKAPKQLYNKLSVLYSLYMDFEVIEAELVALNPIDSNPLAKESSLFGYALYYKNNNDLEKFEKYKNLLKKTNEESLYYVNLIRK